MCLHVYAKTKDSLLLVVINNTDFMMFNFNTAGVRYNTMTMMKIREKPIKCHESTIDKKDVVTYEMHKLYESNPRI